MYKRALLLYLDYTLLCKLNLSSNILGRQQKRILCTKYRNFYILVNLLNEIIINLLFFINIIYKYNFYKFQYHIFLFATFAFLFLENVKND